MVFTTWLEICKASFGSYQLCKDFMIERGFTYYIPPFMIRKEVVTGVMSLEMKT